MVFSSIRFKYLMEKTGTFVKVRRFLVLRWAMVVLSIRAQNSLKKEKVASQLDQGLLHASSGPWSE